MTVVTSAMITIIVKIFGEITPKSSPMLSTISSINPRVFISTPSAAESRVLIPVSLATKKLPPNLPMQATAIKPAHSSQSLEFASNPSSVLFQVRRLLHCVRLLPGEPRFPLSRAEQRLVVIETQLVTADLEKACEGKAEALRALAEECTNLFWQVSDDLARTYFSHAGLAHAVKPSVWVDENLEAR